MTDLTFIRQTNPSKKNKTFAENIDIKDFTYYLLLSGQSVHIEIKFVSYEHGDGDPFDGPGEK